MVDIDKINQNLLGPYTPPMDCYAHPSLNLVFYPNQKSASSHYRQLFTKLNWQVIDINSIDWDRSIVFSHIKDPLIRHRKGIVEGICNYFPEAKEIFLTTIGAKFLTNIPVVESHSYTIERWLGRQNAVKVHWIPIDTNLNHVAETFQFLQKHGCAVEDSIKQWFVVQPRGNVSTQEEIELYNMLMKHETPGEILRYIDFDRCLYAQVVSSYGFEPKGYKQRINQLLTTGLKQQQAEIQADKEVESGDYLNWSYKE